jgi:hypothetical protein
VKPPTIDKYWQKVPSARGEKLIILPPYLPKISKINILFGIAPCQLGRALNKKHLSQSPMIHPGYSTRNTPGLLASVDYGGGGMLWKNPRKINIGMYMKRNLPVLC